MPGTAQPAAGEEANFRLFSESGNTSGLAPRAASNSERGEQRPACHGLHNSPICRGGGRRAAAPPAARPASLEGRLRIGGIDCAGLLAPLRATPPIDFDPYLRGGLGCTPPLPPPPPPPAAWSPREARGQPGQPLPPLQQPDGGVVRLQWQKQRRQQAGPLFSSLSPSVRALAA